MKVRARLKKLEETTGKGRRCAWCRLHLRQVRPPSPSDDGTPPPGSVTRACPECGTKYSQPLTVDDGSLLSKAVALYQEAAGEKELYTVARYHAAQLWVAHWMFRERKSLEGYWERRKKIEADKKRKETPAQKLRAALLVEAEADRKRRLRALREKYGRPFPELDAVAKRLSVVMYDESSYRTTPEEIAGGWRAWAELERVMFGEPSAETVAKIEEFEAKAVEAAEAKAKAEREKIAREAEYQRRREEERRRVDERMGRHRAQPVEDAAPTSREAWRAQLAPVEDDPDSLALKVRAARLDPVEIPPEPERRLVWDEKLKARRYADDPDGVVMQGGYEPAEMASFPSDPTAGMKITDVLEAARTPRVYR